MTQTVFIKKNRIELLDTLPKMAYGSEIGVFRGDFSACILDHCSPRRLYLVDVWQGMMHSGDREGEPYFSIDMSEEMNNVIARFSEDPRVAIVKSYSWEWLHIVSSNHNKLDWVYIDTDHTYETTVKELDGAAMAVKSGGFICGHDYADEFPGVIKAVNEFSLKHDLTLEVWDVQKPNTRPYESDHYPSFKMMYEPDTPKTL